MCDTPAAASKEAAGAPEAEIVITPEMRKAGRLALLAFDKDYEGFEEASCRIFMSMLSAVPARTRIAASKL